MLYMEPVTSWKLLFQDPGLGFYSQGPAMPLLLAPPGHCLQGVQAEEQKSDQSNYGPGSWAGEDWAPSLLRTVCETTPSPRWDSHPAKTQFGAWIPTPNPWLRRGLEPTAFALKPLTGVRTYWSSGSFTLLQKFSVRQSDKQRVSWLAQHPCGDPSIKGAQPVNKESYMFTTRENVGLGEDHPSPSFLDRGQALCH